jgi:hypothetical protein
VLARRALRLEGKIHRFFIGQLVPGPLLLSRQELERMLTCETPHLLNALDRHQGSQWLALALDNELIMPERDSVQPFADARSNVHCRHSRAGG